MTNLHKELAESKKRVDHGKAISYLRNMRDKEYIWFSFDSLEDTKAVFMVEDSKNPDLKVAFRTRATGFLKRQVKKVNLNESSVAIIFLSTSIDDKNLEKVIDMIILITTVRPRTQFVVFTSKKDAMENILEKYFSKSENKRFILGKSEITLFPDLLETLTEKSQKMLLKEVLSDIGKTFS